MNPAACNTEGCDRPGVIYGWCMRHYVLVPAEQRFWVRVMKTDSCWAWLGAKISTGYGAIRVDGKVQLAHRYAYQLLVGPIPEGMMIDHQCRQRNCVNPSHLKQVTAAENSENRGLDPRNTSGYRGVCWSKQAKGWVAYISRNNRHIQIGVFSSVTEAATAARIARLEHYSNSLSDEVTR